MSTIWDDMWEHDELSEKDQRYMVMYGCTQDDMLCMMNVIGGHYMLAMSILSDAQEVILYDPEKARQLINKAKYVIRHLRDGE